MYRIILVILLVFLSAQVVFCQAFEAMGLSQDLREAVLRNPATGEERIVTKGDTIDGWKVIEITSTHVTVGRQLESGGAIATTIPVRIRLRPKTQSP
jgi:hypothetical protein